MRKLIFLMLLPASLLADRQIINTGQQANDGTGDPLRVANIKANANFKELYDMFGGVGANVGTNGLPTTLDSKKKWRGALGLTNVVDVKADYGALGDGIADDTAAIQNAINEIQATGKRQMHIPAGVYLLSSGLSVSTKGNLIIDGDGPAASILKLTSGAGPVLTVNGTSRLFNVDVRDLQVTAASGLMPDGIKLANVSQCATKNIAIYNCNWALTLDGEEIFSAQNCTFADNNTGVYLTHQAAGGFGYANLWASYCNWSQNTNAAIYADCPIAMLSVDNSWIEESKYGLYLTNRPGNPVEFDNLGFSHCLFQILPGSQWTGVGEFVHAEPTATSDYFILNQLKIDDCKLKPTDSQYAMRFLKGSNTDPNTHFSGISFSSTTVNSLDPAGAAVYSDTDAFAGSCSDFQVSGAAKKAGLGYLGVDATANAVYMANANNIAELVIASTTGNDIQIRSFATNSALGFFQFDNSKSMYFDIGGDGNDFQLEKNRATVFGSLWQRWDGAMLSLVGSNSAYMGIYPKGESAGRKAYFGFGNPALPHLSLINEDSSGYLELGTAGTPQLMIYETGNIEAVHSLTVDGVTRTALPLSIAGGTSITATLNNTHSNSGALGEVTATLPTPGKPGDWCEFVVRDAVGWKVQAQTGVTIRISGSISTSGGYIESIALGDVVRLVALNATEWHATSIVGSGWAAH